jgi:hypothetical protein
LLKLLPSTSRTIPVPLRIVESSSKYHLWLLPPWAVCDDGTGEAGPGDIQDKTEIGETC